MQIALLGFEHQGLIAEKSSAQKLNQGMCTDVLKYHPCLNFFGYFLFSTCPDSSGEKKVTKHIKKRVSS
jgi:hypothetical protein